VAMIAGTHTPPIVPRTFAAVLKPASSIGGVAATFKNTNPSFKCAIIKPTGSLLQAAYYNNLLDAVQTDDLVTDVNWGGQELVCIWRTDGSTVELFINGVKQPLVSAVVGADDGVTGGFSLGNFTAGQWIEKDGFQGDICFGGVWARKFTDAEILSATAYLQGLYVTP
jgi:hypothetical protein